MFNNMYCTACTDEATLGEVRIEIKCLFFSPRLKNSVSQKVIDDLLDATLLPFSLLIRAILVSLPNDAVRQPADSRYLSMSSISCLAHHKSS